MIVQVYGDNTAKKTAVYRWLKRFSEGRECVTANRDQDTEQQTELKITLKKIKLCVKIAGWLSGAYQSK
jgi:hypothetical protein